MFVASDTKEENKSFKNALEQEIKNLYVVGFSKMMKPKVKITNISKDYKKEEIDITHTVVNGAVKVT